MISYLEKYWGVNFEGLIERQTGLPVEHDTFLMTDSMLLLKELFDAKNKYCVIYPDYDPDGIFSGLIYYYTLKALRYNVHVMFPSTDDGYGLTPKSCERLLSQHPNAEIVLTTDNGIAAFDGIDYAKEHGLKVLVTDHHLPKDTLPNADVMVNPNREGDKYPFKAITGTAVIWKLMTEFVRVVAPHLLNAVLDLEPFVGFSSVSDLMPLVDENVQLVKSAVRQIQTGVLLTQKADVGDPFFPMWLGLSVFIQTLDEAGNLNYGVDESTIGFYIAPILNSPRRMTAESTKGFELFMQTNRHDAEVVMDELFKMNEARKSLMDKLYRSVDKVMDKIGYDTGVVVTNVYGGLVGLVAGNFTEKRKLPTLALSKGVDEATDSTIAIDDSEWQDILADKDYVISGSGRAPKGFNVLAILNHIAEVAPDCLHHFGGHAQACGVGIYANKLEEFRTLFMEQVELQKERLANEVTVFEPFIFDVDDVYKETVGLSWSKVGLGDFKDFLKFIDGLKPFGQGFSEPVFKFVFEASSFDRKALKDGLHVKYEHRKLPFSIVEWKQNGVLDTLFEQPIVEVVGFPKINSFYNEVVQLTVK